MKKTILLLAITGCGFICSPVFSQQMVTADSLGLPGDNLNLYGVLNLFQESPTLEDFEKKLNDQNTKLNNLDLNGDNKIDYIKVIDNVKGSSHDIVLQVAVNKKENQDVAVIEVDKDKDDQVKVQIVGDEALYGKNYIVEPSEATVKGTPNPGYKDKVDAPSQGGQTIITNNNYYDRGVVYEPNYWPVVRYMYAPSYVMYVSPWYWNYYPSYWYAWQPFYFHAYYGYWYHHPHFGYYHRTDICRSQMAHSYYGERRAYSETVNQRRESGGYRSTYSRPDLGPNKNERMENQNRNGGARNQNIERDRNSSQPNNNTREKVGTPRNNNSNMQRNNNSAPRNNNSTPRNNNSVPRNNNSAPRNNSGAPRNNSYQQSRQAPSQGGGSYRMSAPSSGGRQGGGSPHVSQPSHRGR